MNAFALHPEAYADLDEIWEYVADDNLDAADRVREEIFDTLRLLAKLPGQGHQRPDLTSLPLLFHPVRDHVIAYAAEKPLNGDRCAARPPQSARAGRHPQEPHLKAVESASEA